MVKWLSLLRVFSFDADPTVATGNLQWRHWAHSSSRASTDNVSTLQIFLWVKQKRHNFCGWVQPSYLEKPFVLWICSCNYDHHAWKCGDMQQSVVSLVVTYFNHLKKTAPPLNMISRWLRLTTEITWSTVCGIQLAAIPFSRIDTLKTRWVSVATSGAVSLL